jgi:maltose 6'-phosphate phosphatase
MLFFRMPRSRVGKQRSRRDAMTPIELLYAKNTIARRGDTVQQDLAFALVVQNLACNKQVEVVWTGEDGTRHSLKANYLAPAGCNGEIWHAHATFSLTADDSLPGDIQFVLHCRQAECDHWYPSNHCGWTVNADSGIRIGNLFSLVNVDYQPHLHLGQQFLPVTIAVRQNLQPEKVSIRWTTDRWRTFTDTPAFLLRKHWHHTIGSAARNPNRYGAGVWISQLHLGDAYQVEYALCCKVKDREYWDNNFGNNYLSRHDPLRIMTLNLHCYQEDRQDEKFAQIAKAVQDLQADVVCLQEVGELWNDGRGDWNSNAAKLICDRLGDSYSLHTDWSHLGFDRYREGTAILSRYPFVLKGAKYVSPTQNAYDIHARKVVMAQIHVPYFGAVNVFSVHLSWWQNGFQEQFENLRRWAESEQTPNVAATFLCGDFNNAANSQGHAILSREYEDQFYKANAQRINRADDRRIDYLLLKKGVPFRVRSACQLFTPADYGPVSDHEGYFAEFDPLT